MPVLAFGPKSCLVTTVYCWLQSRTLKQVLRAACSNKHGPACSRSASMLGVRPVPVTDRKSITNHCILRAQGLSCGCSSDSFCTVVKSLLLAGARSTLSRPLLASTLLNRCCAPGQVAAVHLFSSRQLCCLLKIRFDINILNVLVPQACQSTKYEKVSLQKNMLENTLLTCGAVCRSCSL